MSEYFKYGPFKYNFFFINYQVIGIVNDIKKTYVSCLYEIAYEQTLKIRKFTVASEKEVKSTFIVKRVIYIKIMQKKNYAHCVKRYKSFCTIECVISMCV